MRGNLTSHDPAKPATLQAKVKLQPESFSAHVPESGRKVAIEQSGGLLKVRAYDGYYKSPLSVMIPMVEFMYTAAGDYYIETRQPKKFHASRFLS